MPGGEFSWVVADYCYQVIITLGMNLDVRQQLKFVGASAWRYSLNSLIGQPFVTRQQVDNTAIGFRITLRDIQYVARLAAVACCKPVRSRAMRANSLKNFFIVDRI
jgi:hypothetical protein